MQGVIVEKVQSGIVYEDTLFYDNEKKIDNWLKKEGSKELFSSAELANVSGSLSNLSIGSILNLIEKSNTFSEKTSKPSQNGGGIGEKTQESPLRFSIVEGIL